MSAVSAAAIEVQNLKKRYNKVEAVKGASFTVGVGEIFGFLGPNGAGKTTIINMLTGLSRPMGGSISYFGHDYTNNIKKAQHLMGVVPDESNLYPEMSGFENLCFCASLYGIGRKEREQRARQLLESFGLAVTEPLKGIPSGIEQVFSDVAFELQTATRLRAITKKALPLAPVIRALEEQGVAVIEARAIRPSLEEVFVRITGIEAQKMKAEKERKNKQ